MVINIPFFNRKPEEQKKNLSNVISPIALQRFRHDIQMWREACAEAEQGFVQLRQRVRMQRMYVDTVLNEHVEACIKKRRRLTMQKKFIVGVDAENPDENWTNYFSTSEWFENFLTYVLDSPLYGYTLIALGNVVETKLPELTFVRRTHVSPDRKVVSTFEYSMSGTSFEEGEAADWHVYISTPTETGVSPCGYGLLYKIAKTEILLRNNTTYNADFNEMYGQPIRKGRTRKQDPIERDLFFQALVDMAHKGAILLDEGIDELDLLPAGTGAGSGWQGFENFEKRLEAKISKVILGHSDALDSTPGKLGGQDGEDNPVATALRQVENEDANLCERVVNEMLLPRLRKIGFSIPDEFRFVFLNNKEKNEIREEEDKRNKATGEMVKTFKDSSMTVDPAWVEERTGIRFIIQEEKKDVEAEARANLRGSVGGVQGIISLQQSVAEGKTEKAAAIATLEYVYGYTTTEATAIVGNPPKPQPPELVINDEKLNLSKKVKNKLREIYR